MDSDRTALEGLRRDLLTAAADRDEDQKAHACDRCDAEFDTTKEVAVHYEKRHPYIKNRNKTSMRSEARHFIAEQECDDLRELTIRAKNYAEKVSSTLPANKSRAFVASFVEAVRGEHRVAAGNYSMDHYMEYARRNGLHPGDKLTVDRYSREHGVPQERASDYAMQFNKSANRRIAATADFPASLMYLE